MKHIRYTTGEVAKRLNLSVRTIRYYDHIQLVRPNYVDVGQRRYYGNEEMLRFQQVILLKTMSLSLEDIRLVLEEQSLLDVLNAHQLKIEADLSRLERVHEQTLALRHLSRRDESIDWEQLFKLAREAHSPRPWKTYFDETSADALESRLPKLGRQDVDSRRWMNLLRRIEILIERGVPPEAEEARLVNDDLTDLTVATFGDDPELLASFWDVRKSEDASKAMRFVPIAPEVIAYIEALVSENNH